MRNSLLLFIALFLTFTGVFSQPGRPGSDELYQARLATLKTSIELIYRAEVKQYIDAYIENPDRTREIIQQSKTQFPLIERALRSKGVSTDLKYLAVALSELDPRAKNPYGANGIWMMMFNVGKMYKVKVNSFVDERLDPYKSSVVAASHFRDLYSIYHQWPLVIAAYAASPVMLNKCIRMANNSLYFWDVYPFLPETTRDIYPKYIAAVYIMNFYREHGIRAIGPEARLETDSVLVNKWLSLQQISATIDIPLEMLRKLNPIFKKDIIPYNLDGYWVNLPAGKAAQFDRLKDSVYNPLPRPADFVPVQIQHEPNDSTVARIAETPKPEEKRFDKKRLYYSVKKGDNLADIADWFDVTQREIVSWNKLKSTKVVRGRKLIIWVNEKKTGYYKRINTMSAVQKKKLKRKD